MSEKFSVTVEIDPVMMDLLGRLSERMDETVSDILARMIDDGLFYEMREAGYDGIMHDVGPLSDDVVVALSDEVEDLYGRMGKALAKILAIYGL